MVRLEDFKVAEIKKMISKYNKEVKITTSGLKKADLIKKIREHPRLTVTESDKGISIKVNSDTTMGGKKIKIKKDKQSSKSKDDENIAEQVKEKPAAEGTKPKAQLGQSGIGKKRKRVEGPPKKKKIIDVAVKKEKPKPKVPTITITESEKPKKKVIKRGGRFITVKPKEPKADLPPIPKSKAKIRVAPKKEEKKDLEKDTNEFYLDKFNKLIKSDYFKKRSEGIQEADLRDLVSKMINPNRYTTIGQANQRKKKLNKAYTTIKNYIDNLKSKSPAPKKELKSKAGPAEEKSEDLPKFTKVKPSFKEDTVESLTKAIKHHKKQGNDAIVNKLEKDLKKLKGKGKAKPKTKSKEKPVEQPKDSFSIGKFPFKIKVDDKNIILKKNTPKQNKEDEKILRNRTDNMKRKITMKVGMTLMKLMKITDPKKIREEENNIVADPSILTTNKENRIVRQFSLMKYKNLQDKEDVYKFPRTAVPDTLALL